MLSRSHIYIYLTYRTPTYYIADYDHNYYNCTLMHFMHHSDKPLQVKCLHCTTWTLTSPKLGLVFSIAKVIVAYISQHSHHLPREYHLVKE